MKHKIGTVNFLLALWLCAFCHLAMAQGTLAHDMRGYDVESLGWAALMSVFGGALRTIFTLATDDRVVNSLWRESGKDAIVAVIAGTLAYITVEATRASGALPVPSEVRFAVIVFAGWSRLSFFGWINAMGIRVTDAITERLSRMASGGAAVPQPAPAPAAPPEAPKPRPFQEKQP